MILKNKTVLVTGASKGIGQACAEAFAKEGVNIVINYARDEAAAQEVAGKVKSYGVKVLVTQADITNSAEVEAMFAKIKEEFSTLDVIVNNAGIFAGGDSPDNLDAIRKDFETNLFAQISITNAACKLMTKGKIIFTSSFNGGIGRGRPDAIGYSASKAALDSYMKNLAKALAPDILVNSVAPGNTVTPIWGEITDEMYKTHAADQLIARWVEPEEVADSVIFLAKNDAMCGEILAIDGGLSLKILG